MSRFMAAVLLVAVVAGCGPSATAGGPAAQAELQVYAAASLKKALEAARGAYETARPGTRLALSTDSSAALATKIEQGAPADVFLSADMTNPQRLVDAGLAAGAVTPFAGNELTVIVPADNPAGIKVPADLGRAGVKLIAAVDGVPIQRYTAQWLELVASLPAYGADFVDRVASNVVSREDNVSAVVTKVGLGEGDAAVVYATDARVAEDVATIEIPASENVPATYGGIVVKASPDQAAAAAFLGWLAGPDGGAILASFGFLPSAP